MSLNINSTYDIYLSSNININLSINSTYDITEVSLQTPIIHSYQLNPSLSSISSTYNIYSNSILDSNYNILIYNYEQIKSLYYININSIYILNQKYYINSNKYLQNIKISYYINTTHIYNIKTIYYIDDVIHIINQKYYIYNAIYYIFNQRYYINTTTHIRNISSLYYVEHIMNIKSQYQIFYTFNNSSFETRIEQFEQYNFSELLSYGILPNTTYYSILSSIISSTSNIIYQSEILKIMQQLPQTTPSFILQIDQVQTQNYSTIEKLSSNKQYNYSNLLRIQSVEDLFNIQNSILNRLGNITFENLLSNLLFISFIQLKNISTLISLQQYYIINYSNLLKISNTVLFKTYSIKESIIYNYNIPFSNILRLTTRSLFTINESILFNYDFQIINSDIIREYWINIYSQYPAGQIILGETKVTIPIAPPPVFRLLLQCSYNIFFAKVHIIQFSYDIDSTKTRMIQCSYGIALED